MEYLAFIASRELITFSRDLVEIRFIWKGQMFSSSKGYIPLVLVTFAYAAYLSLPISIIQISNDTNIHLDGTSSNLTEISPHCSSIYGSGFKVESCRNAWDKMDHSSTTPQEYARRRFMTTRKKPVPFRYLSDDGICAIDVDLKVRANDDFSTGRAISEYAKMILDQCVLSSRKGGRIKDFGEFLFHRSIAFKDPGSCLLITPAEKFAGGSVVLRSSCELTRALLFALGRYGTFIITIRSYEPSVDCDPLSSNVPTQESCQGVLTIMPSAVSPRPFGERPVVDEKHTYGLPRNYSSGMYCSRLNLILCALQPAIPCLCTEATSTVAGLDWGQKQFHLGPIVIWLFLSFCSFLSSSPLLERY